MAKDPKEKDQAKEDVAEEGAKPKKKGGKKLLFILLGLVLALGLAGGGAAWFFLTGEPAGKDAKAKDEQQKAKDPPMFASLEPFTVNIRAAEGGTENYLQIAIELKVAEKNVVEKVKLHMPEIRNSILLLLTSKNVEELKTVEGKQKLAADIQAAVNKPMGLPGGKGVTGVYFTSFVIQ